MTLYLDHVASAGAWDESLITDAIIVAYNNVHGSDYTLDSGFMEEQIEIPEDEDDESFETNILGGKSKYYYSVSWYNFGYCKCYLLVTLALHVSRVHSLRPILPHTAQRAGSVAVTVRCSETQTPCVRARLASKTNVRLSLCVLTATRRQAVASAGTARLGRTESP